MAELQLVTGDALPPLLVLLSDVESCFGLAAFLVGMAGGVSVPLPPPVFTCCRHLALLFLNHTCMTKERKLLCVVVLL